VTAEPTPDSRPQVAYDVVVPTVGRPSLGVLLRSLAESMRACGESGPRAVVVVDDRPGADGLDLDVPDVLTGRVRVVCSGGRGPAAARNAGWRAGTAEWVAFVDDDVELPAGWARALVEDLAATGPRVGGSQGRIVVPLPLDRRPTDWERGTAGLSHAAWATADMAYRRTALEAVGGFDERFPRAYREDADLALRVLDAGFELTRGARYVVHPVRPESAWVSLRVQRGNADDVLMRRLHGPDWRQRAQAPPGRLPKHVATVAAAATAVVAAASGHRRTARFAAVTWAGATAEFALRRLLPGPWTRREVATMVATSAAIPFAATAHRLRGEWRHRAQRPAERPVVAATPLPPRTPPARPAVVLFDRDGTLVHDVPYNGDPALVRPVDTAAAAIARLRAEGVRIGVVTNQSGIARGLLDEAQVRAVNARVDELLGPFDVWMVCPHQEADRCGCRKPAPGMVLTAAARLGVDPTRCAVIGDIGRDVEAAEAAGAVGVLVPTPVTREEEVRRARYRAPDLLAAVDLLLDGAARPDDDRAADGAPQRRSA
jgi:HAD superfamily hydrolase (TIGR01662 family)